ncbi:hypothetical protein CMO83_02115 [Candidatus Woesearchaeota archaeon]|jgi:hypothetical protein|nr:hypothetical protein [Candidatus Woesearchaeota archaeon]
MFNKKARTVMGHVILWIPKFIYLIIAFLSVIFLLGMLIVNNIDASKAEAKILMNRIFYSPNAISYLDSDIGRSYPGIIDFEKFQNLDTEPNFLDSQIITYGENNGLIAAKLTLENMDTSEESIIFYNKNNYEFWEPRILPTVEGGSGSVRDFTEERYVLIKNLEGVEKGILTMHVIVRK